MRIRDAILFLAAAVSVSACASLAGSRDQSIRVALAPSEASCLVLKDDIPVASVAGGDGTVTTTRSKHALVFECQARGYAPKTLRIESSAPGWGRFRCLLVDLCLGHHDGGAMRSYPEAVTITLDKPARSGSR